MLTDNSMLAHNSMLTEKELILLMHLRQNSRKSLTAISNETNIPVSTLFNILRKLESSVVNKHVSLMDFSKIGYSTLVNFAIRAQLKRELREFLMGHPNVNSLSSLINEYDFYAHCVFRSMKDVMKFKEDLHKFGIKNIDENFVVEDIDRESFHTMAKFTRE